VTDLPLWLSGLLLIVGVPALAVGAQLALRQRWSALREGDHNEVAGFVIAIVGVIYAVLLAFVVIVSWEQFSKAESVTVTEASALRTMYRAGTAYTPEIREQIRIDVRDYARTVIDVEWPAMARGESGSPAVAGVLDRTGAHLTALPTGTPTQQEYAGVEADRFNDLVSARAARLDFVEGGVPGVLWLALVVGAVVTIGFSMIFAMSSALLQTLMTASLSVLIGVLLFVAVAIDHPFAGDVAVAPRPLERVLADFGGPGS
jgi:type II secretory pathway pseudopilin PulG